MKRVIVAVVLLLLIGGGCCLSIWMQSSVVGDCVAQTETMETQFIRGDIEGALTTAETFCTEYMQKTRWFSLVLPHNTLTEVEKCITGLPAILTHGEHKDFVAEVRRCRLLLQNMYDLEKPTWQNIF